MKSYLSHLLYDLTALKSILFVWGPILAMVVASQWINKLDPNYRWQDQDPLYWGDTLLVIALVAALVALLIYAIVARIKYARAVNRAKSTQQ